MPSQENLSKNSKAMFKAMALALQPTTKALSTQTAILNRIALTSEKQTAEEAFKDNKARKVGQENEKKQTGFLKGIFEKGKKNTGILGFLGKHWGKILIGLTLLLTPMSKLIEGFKWLKEFWTNNTLHEMGMKIGGGILAAWGIKTAVGLTLQSLLKALFFKKAITPTTDKTTKTTKTDKTTKTTKTTKVKPKTPGVFRTVAKSIGAAAVMYEGINSASRKHTEELARRAGKHTPRQMANMNSRTATPTKIRTGMEDGLTYYADIAKGAVAAVVGAGGDTVKWIDPDAKLVILPTSKEVSDALDKAQKVGTKKYVEGVKNLGKNIGEVVDKISKTDIIPDGVTVFTSKQKDDFVPRKNSDTINRMGTQPTPQEKSWWEKSKDWYDKKLAPSIGGNQHYGSQIGQATKISTSSPAESGAQGKTMKSFVDKINWKFISEKEGDRKLKGYVPNPDKSDSGVTIATGFDLGARGPQDLLGLSPKLKAKLTPYLGFKKRDAEIRLKDFGPLNITAAEASEIDKFSKGQSVSNLRAEWNERAKELGPSAKRFGELNSAQQTIAASVAFQYGSLSRTPNFRKMMQTGNWRGAIGELRNFGDGYKSRRKDEANYLETSLQGAPNYKQGYNVTPHGMGPGAPANTIIIKQGDNSSSNPMTFAQSPGAGDSYAEKLNNTLKA